MALRSLTSRSDPIEEARLDIDPACTMRILESFIRRELTRTGRERLVVGLSGGLDSAVAAFVAVRALGKERVLGLLLPYRTSSASSLEDARRVVEALEVEAETVDISAMVDGFAEPSGEVSRHRLGNVMARLRMVLLFDRSEQHEALVLGTSNKTELLLGYGTLNGDLASAINPLGDLYKTQVRTLAEHLGVPRSIRVKPPSADLWPDQTDEADLGLTYAEVDRLLVLLIDARIDRATAIESGFSEEMVDSVIRRIVRSQFKRRPPVIAKLSKRSIDWDFRYPRDWLT